MNQPDDSLPLVRLRALLQDRALDAALVPRTDAYQSEVTAPHDDCLAWLSGFTGSAGVGLVLPGRALLFVDGRYQVQARAEVDPALFEIRHLHDAPPERWLKAHARPGWRVGFDPMRFSAASFDRLAAACAAAGARLEPFGDDPFDLIWPGRPPSPLGPVRAMPVRVAGESAAEKRARIAAQLRETGADLLAETAPDNIAWLLNLRGSDVPMNPVPHSFLILGASGAISWYVDRRKLGNDLSGFELGDVTIGPPGAFLDDLAAAAAGKTALIDPNFTPAGVKARIEAAGGRIIAAADPVMLAKAVKNPAELQGFRDCHLQDGAALTEFLAWVSAEAPRRAAAAAPLTEIEAEAQLHAFRATRPGFLEDSFRTISAAGPNAAMCHYTAHPATNAVIGSRLPYLVDSGGQYVNGTTDVTRTLMLGPPDETLTRAYTAVLKGFLSLLTARFPTGTKGHQLEAFARRALWDIGLDFDHGSGHSVGHNLLIHEHPHRFARDANPYPLEPGVVMTIEPGFYAAGEFGMRVENQVEVVADGPGFCRFASLTLAPIDLTMARLDALSAPECAALDTYHAEVLEKLRPLVAPAALPFLTAATLPVAARPGAA